MSVGQRRRRRAAVLIFTVATVVAFVFLLNGLAVIRQMRDLEEQWQDQTTIAQVRGAQLFRLQNALGYGGFIDNFKTFILKGDLGALDAATAHLDRAEKELAAIAEGGVGESHPDLIERLRFVIKAYQVRLVMADEAFSEGYSSNEIDSLVNVEDQPALDALRALSDEVHAKMEAVQRETRRRIDEAVGLATLGLLILPLIAVVAWLLVRFLRDMTAANERAGLAASRVEAIIAASPEAMIVVDADGTIVRANTAAGRLLGYEPSRLVGMPSATLIPSTDENREDGDALTLLIGDSGSPVVVGRETWIARRNGDRLPVDISASVTGEDQDALVTMLIRDATLRRNYEQGLIEARQAAERASNAKSEFLANVSHEVRTPINAIIGLSGLLQKTPLSDQQWDYVSKLHTAGRRLLDLVNDMLDFARIDAGRMEIEMAPFDPRELIDQVATVAAVHAEAKNLELIFRVSRGMPQLAIGDENRLGQVLSNLVSNAIKFTNEGSVIVETDAEALVKGATVLRFAVRDTGIGIPAAQLDQLFEAFTQADTSAARKHGGAGLGLAICQSLVEAMGGAISAESAVGEGSVFRFSVTVQVPAEIAADSPSSATADPAAVPVLVVDDNEAVRSVLAEELSAAGFPVTTVGDGRRALEEVSTEGASKPAYAVALIDWQMPGMDGIRVIRDMADALGDAMPVTILITSFDGTEARAAAASLPVDAFLEKPINTSTLIDNLMDALAERRRGEAGEHRRSESAARIAAIGSVAGGGGLLPHAVGARVLVVDDNSINRQVAKELLAEIGAVPELAESGQQAVDILASRPAGDIDLVLMDIQMPVMDGIATTEKLRADGRYDKLPIVALTAHAIDEERDRCFRAGMDGLISKPVTVQQLIETLNAWVGSERTDREAAFGTETAAPGEPGESGGAATSQDIEAMPLFDPGRVATLKNLSDGFLEQMLRDFGSRYRGAAAEIRSLLAQNEFDRAKTLAHTIKGTSGSLGAERLFGAARQLDEALKEPRDGERIERMAGAFEETLSLTLGAIERDYGTN